ncbi:MAG: putative lipid II flippase FtsW [Gammaproteobacteria bacterium]|nr:MAG: putative lipid II flippase FtsW [Gammaproteobacteria bacterium]
MSSLILLLSLGSIMVYSASISIAEQTTGNAFYFISRHIVHVILGLGLMVLVMHMRIRQWEAAGPFLLLTGIILLVLVVVPGIGVSINGSSRWLRLGIFNVQPSEFVKLAMVVYVAGYLVRHQEKLKLFVPGILMIGLVVAIVGVLLLQEPDLGTVAVISITVLTMMFLAGVRFWHFMAIVFAGAGSMVALTLISPYRMNRVTGFLDPWADPFDAGFQLVQALIAFGRGEWFGVGLGASIQKLSYLPAAHTDFLFAVFAEEFGLLGILLVIVLFGVLVTRALIIARSAEESGQLYAARLVQGIAVWLGAQAMINMGVNMGVLPTKGLTLPFMSYGGSSILSSSIAVGLLLMVERELRTRTWRRR